MTTVVVEVTSVVVVVTSVVVEVTSVVVEVTSVVVDVCTGVVDEDGDVVGAFVKHFRGHPPRMLRSCSHRSHERQVCSIEQKVQSPQSRWT